VDFWSGKSQEGGKGINADAPLERLPLFVRAGSVVPLGPEVQWSGEKPADPPGEAIEIRVYRGADGSFTLYEDENDNYNYEKGAWATIPIWWDDARGELTIGDRKGNYPGMPEKRSFRVVLVAENHGAGIEPEGKPDAVVQYSGTAITVPIAPGRPRPR
jgi:alpha-D-xyloside xylohydrolase